MVKLKHNSKRQSLKQKYAIIKKVSAHNKKMKKMIKKSNLHKRKVSRKSLIIPQCQFKDDILYNVKLMKNTKQNNNIEKGIELEIDDIKNVPLEYINYMMKNKKSNDKNTNNIKHENSFIFENFLNLSIEKKIEIFENEKKKIFREIKDKYEWSDELLNIIKYSDIIFYIVDIRNPLLYIDNFITNFIKKCEREVIIVLNKCDLVDNAIIQQWLIYFRSKYVTIPFISYINKEFLCLNKKNIENISYMDIDNIIKKYYNFLSILTENKKVVYGIIGNLNVGKSSFLHTLLNCKYFSNNSNNNFIDIKNIHANISVNNKIGLLLKKELNRIEVINKINGLNINEKCQYFIYFLSCINKNNLCELFLYLNKNDMIDKLNSIIDFNEENIINLFKLFFFQKKVNSNKFQIIKKNFNLIYEGFINSKLPYSIIPQTKITNIENNLDILKSFNSLENVYENFDKLIFSLKKKHETYIIIENDILSNFEYNQI